MGNTRRGYWYLTDSGDFDGPYQTVREAKEASSSFKEQVSIRTMICVERRNEAGEWSTAH